MTSQGSTDQGSSRRQPQAARPSRRGRAPRRWTVKRWDDAAAWPLAVAAVAFLVAYSWEILATDLSPRLRLLLQVVDYVTWAVFAVDYLVRVLLAKRRGEYFVRHIFDLLIVVLPLLQPLRLLRLFVLLRFIERRAASSLQGRVASYVGVSTVLLLYTGGLAEFAAERDVAGANITDFGTALWWALTTITTVGYGDHYPVSFEGRLVAAVLMIAGVALIGVVTATVAAWLVQRVSRPGRAEDEGETSIAELRAQVAELTEAVRQLNGPPQGTAPGRDPHGTAPSAAG
ncbi:potassium channel family protein [Micropruina sonneratiae]|uniref:potassium channel family protein n=1 Tax=Micropruina sonneratiae TaxID=2986940 RepID=UPI0029D41B36|nr:potassium channel family protein [Micropruina sp. KQZ13P-5]